MGRAIVREPRAFLMDEPLSNLDAKLRVDMRAQLARLHAELQVTTVYVTHDQVEAMTLGQRVAVMRDGRIQQVDTPQNALPAAREPVRRGVHRLAGDEPRRGGGHRRTASQFAGLSIPLPPRRRPAPGRVVLGIRPQDFSLAETADAGLPAIEVEPAVVEELGSATHAIFPIEAPPVDTRVGPRRDRRRRLDACCSPPTGARSSRRRSPEGTQVAVGSRCGSRSIRRRLHFFDPETGARLEAAAPAGLTRRILRADEGRTPSASA